MAARVKEKIKMSSSLLSCYKGRQVISSDSFFFSAFFLPYELLKKEEEALQQV